MSPIFVALLDTQSKMLALASCYRLKKYYVSSNAAFTPAGLTTRYQKESF